jgi:flagellar basal-body rod protein FlgG
MIRALWTAATGMGTQQLNLDVIANNIANINTIGFKKARAEFQDLLYQETKKAGSETASGSQVPVGVEVGMGAKITATKKMFSQGDFRTTDNAYDLVIEGNGFFQLDDNGTNVYTRAGSFTTNKDGVLCNPEGLKLAPNITIPIETVNFQVLPDGSWQARDKNSAILASGRIELARFVNPAGLKSLGRNLYGVTDSSGTAVTGNPGETGYGTLTQNAVEMSNVNVVDEMVQMIMGQRAYEINTKAIQTADQILSLVSNLKR